MKRKNWKIFSSGLMFIFILFFYLAVPGISLASDNETITYTTDNNEYELTMDSDTFYIVKDGAPDIGNNYFAGRGSTFHIIGTCSDNNFPKAYEYKIIVFHNIKSLSDKKMLHRIKFMYSIPKIIITT